MWEKRSIASILLLLAVCLPLTGCNGDSQPKQNEVEKPKVEEEEKTKTAESETKKIEMPPEPKGPSAEELFQAFVDANINPDEQTWQKSHDDLYNLGEKAVPALTEGLKSEDAQTRELAAVILAELGPKSEGAKKELQAALDDESESVRVNAASTLTLLSDPDEKLTATLTELIKSDDSAIQKTAVFSFSNLGEDSLKPLMELLKSSNKNETRLDVIRAIASLKKVASSVREELKEMSESEDEAGDVVEELKVALEAIPE